MVIRILDHVPQASTYEDGEVIFNLLRDSIERGDEVVLSFDGILAVPSSFVNAALVRLLEIVPFRVVRSRLRIRDSTKQINDLVRSRFQFVAETLGQTSTF